MSGNPYQRANPSLEKQRAVGRASEAAYEQGAARHGDKDQDYPFPLWARDPRDTKMAIKEEMLLNRVDGRKVTGNIQYGEEDIDYILTKRQQEEAIAKDMWVSTLFDMTRPEVVSHVKSIMPDFFDRQKQYFDGAMEAAKTFTRINMQGIQSKEDIDFLWHVKTGVIHVPSGFLPHQLTQPLAESVVNAQRDIDESEFTSYVRGPFSWYRNTRERATAPSLGYSRENQINPWASAETPYGIGTRQLDMFFPFTSGNGAFSSTIKGYRMVRPGKIKKAQTVTWDGSYPSRDTLRAQEEAAAKSSSSSMATADDDDF